MVGINLLEGSDGMSLAKFDVGKYIDFGIFYLIVVAGETILNGEILFWEGGNEACPENEKPDGVCFMNWTKFIKTLTESEKYSFLKLMIISYGMEATKLREIGI